MNNDINKIFSKNLRRLLNEKNATQLDLANYIGVSNTTINNYVKGYNMPRMDKVDDIAKFFNVRREDLIMEESESDRVTPKEAIRILLSNDMVSANTGININNYSDEDLEDITDRLLEYARFLNNDKRNNK